jgi:hypothetical protein
MPSLAVTKKQAEEPISMSFSEVRTKIDKALNMTANAHRNSAEQAFEHSIRALRE